MGDGSGIRRPRATAAVVSATAATGNDQLFQSRRDALSGQAREPGWDRAGKPHPGSEYGSEAASRGLGNNSIKLYDKAYTGQAAVLRPEVTINDPAQFKVYRPKEGDPQGELAWRQMRRGIADLHRRAEVSQKALDRYCEALASVDDSATLEELTARIERRTKWNGTSVRALHPFDPGD